MNATAVPLMPKTKKSISKINFTVQLEMLILYVGVREAKGYNSGFMYKEPRIGLIKHVCMLQGLFGVLFSLKEL
jgi:hypothetical protein